MQIYLEYSRRGARVLALATKELGKLESKTVREIKREDVECDLEFAGFLIISCPLKTDSKNAIKEIVKSSHKVMMITGDNPLTACYVAKELRFTRKPIVVLTKDFLGTDEEPQWIWQSINQEIQLKLNDNVRKLIDEYDLCITGEGLIYLNEFQHEYFLKICPYISVFARFAPKQKEMVVTTLKTMGKFRDKLKFLAKILLRSDISDDLGLFIIYGLSPAL